MIKIVLLTYAISWLILALIVYRNREDFKYDWNDRDWVFIFVLIIIALIAPILVIMIPIWHLYQMIDNRKSRKADKERARQKQEEQEYCSNALAALHKAKANKAQMGSSDFKTFLASANSSYSTNFYTLMKNEENYPLIIEILHKLSLPEGMSLLVEKCKQQGIGDASKLFVKTPRGGNDYNIWDYISVENSVEGAWNAFLLFNLWHVLPMFWHALYDLRNYLFFPEDIDNIEYFGGPNKQILKGVMNDYFTSPDVVALNGKFYVSCCYFSNFGGLIQETVEIEIDNGKASFHLIEKKTLYEFECGIIF